MIKKDYGFGRPITLIAIVDFPRMGLYWLQVYIEQETSCSKSSTPMPIAIPNKDWKTNPHVLRVIY